jgi:catechol 2,3-dioxygenase-like lactoylglutathione lyase family enzyme
MGILNHVCIGMNDRERSVRFYDAVMEPLGVLNLGDFVQGVAYGRKVPELLVLSPLDGNAATSSNGATFGFKAPDRASVDAFHAAGLLAGGSDAGKPGPRQAMPNAYGAYLFDPDGNKICAYCFKPET